MRTLFGEGLGGSDLLEQEHRPWEAPRDTFCNLHFRTHFPSGCKSCALAWIIITCIAGVVVRSRETMTRNHSQRIQVLHQCYYFVLGEGGWSTICWMNQVQLNWGKSMSGNPAMLWKLASATTLGVFLSDSHHILFLFLQRTELELLKTALAKYLMSPETVFFGLYALS